MTATTSDCGTFTRSPIVDATAAPSTIGPRNVKTTAMSIAGARARGAGPDEGRDRVGRVLHAVREVERGGDDDRHDQATGHDGIVSRGGGDYPAGGGMLLLRSTRNWPLLSPFSGITTR